MAVARLRVREAGARGARAVRVRLLRHAQPQPGGAVRIRRDGW